MIAPSILASSESRCGVNSESSRKPPEQTESTSGPSPITMSAPMRAWRMRSRPSRSCVPGATRRRAYIIASVRDCAGTRRTLPEAARANASETSCTGMTRKPGRGLADGGASACETKARRFVEPVVELRHRAQLAAQPDLTHRDHARDDGLLPSRASDREGERKVGAGLGDAQPSGDARVHLGLPRAHTTVLIEHCQHHREARGIETRGRPSGRQAIGYHQGLYFHEQRPRSLEDDGHRGTGHAGAPIDEEP